MNAKEICSMAANGDPDALAFCDSWYRFAHMLDDAYDKDKPVDDNALAGTMVNYTLTLAGNPFFLTNKGMLLGLMIQSANYWVESNRRKGAERDILKSFWHGVIYQVAFIKGGWGYQRRVMSETLSFDYEGRKD